MAAISASAQVTLNAVQKPVESFGYELPQDIMCDYDIYGVYRGLIIIGGVPYKSGFALRNISGTNGFAEFSLKGKYKTLTFAYGSSVFNSDRTSGVFLITGDGRKLLDKVLQPDSVPERMMLDVSGVDRLRFEIVKGDISIGVAEPELWTAGQTPAPDSRISNAPSKVTRLVDELRPYKIDDSHKCISPASGDRKAVKVNGRTYTSGLEVYVHQKAIDFADQVTYFNLGGRYSKLSFLLGPKDMAGGILGSGWITVKADGKTILEEELNEGSQARNVTLDVSGCRQLTFSGDQTDGTIYIVAADMVAYPEGTYKEPEASPVADPRLKSLPNVCKLISNIPPFAITGYANAGSNLFDGKSEHVTFSMGGTRFWEGVILQSSTNILRDNTKSSALFNIGGEFDHISFTTGWISKCGILKNDVLKVYADDKVVMEMPLIATSPNAEYIVPVGRCNILKFELQGEQSMFQPAFGIADIVAYRGEAVPNNLFEHPVPDLPEETDIFSLGNPYIHYIFTMRDAMEKTIHDGSTKKEYFQLGDKRINNGFLLQTSVHFDLEAGAVGGAGTGVAAISAGMAGSAVIGTIGGTTISLVCPFGSLLALAAGGESWESSCAAFNTYGAYDELTFSVACIQQKHQEQEKLLIGADGEVVQEFVISEEMEPATFTLPIRKCKQLMFWIPCRNNTSGQYLFYDIKLRKTDTPSLTVSGGTPGSASAGAVAPVEPYVIPVRSFEHEVIEWQQPASSSGVSAIETFLNDCRKFKIESDKLLQMTEDYSVVAKFFTAADGGTFRSFELVSSGGIGFHDLRLQDKELVKAADSLLGMIALLKTGQAAATASLVELGLGAVAYGKVLKQAGAMLNSYKKQISMFVSDKRNEIANIDGLLSNAVAVDGAGSTESLVFVR